MLMRYSVQGKETMQSAAEYVENLVKNNKVVVFTRATCPFCKKALALLNSYHLPAGDIKNVEVPKISDSEAVMTYILEKTGARSVINGKFIAFNCIFFDFS
ncbi:unnamed protein product [Soboliphyme baturini]|uniref:Glutaredoxin-1 n=1 Tax=Soboliphyme baturini TaxID=241478 RepID=A0A183IMI7_9BILA|nr:unnamed protein product [Soboliphyme baturini]